MLLTSRPVDDPGFGGAVPLEEFDLGEIRALTAGELEEVFHAYLGPGDTAGALSRIPAALRAGLGAPLLAMMAIRVSQAGGDLTPRTEFALFDAYVRVLDDFFNAPGVRRAGPRTGRAVDALAAVAVVLGADPAVPRWTLGGLGDKLRSQEMGEEFRALLNTGLLTAAGGGARFVHRRFYDFGLAVAMVRAVRAGRVHGLAELRPTEAACELARPELNEADEARLVAQLRQPDNTLRRRVLALLRYGASPLALEAVRELVGERERSGRVWSMALRVLAEGGDRAFLAQLGDVSAPGGRRRHARMLANALRLSGRAEYLPALVALADVHQSPSFTGAAMEVALRTASVDVVPALASAYRRHSVKKRAAALWALAPWRDSSALPVFAAALLREEAHPGNVLALLYVARDAVPSLDVGVLNRSADLLALLASPTRRQRRLAAELSRATARAAAAPRTAGEAARRLTVEGRRIAQGAGGRGAGAAPESRG